VAKGNREKFLHIGETQLRSLAKSEKPQWHKIEETGGHLQGGNCPWEAEDIKGLLIVDIVGNVEKVPQGKVGTNLESFSQSGFLGSGSLGSVGTNLNSSSLGPGSDATDETLQYKYFKPW
jgi:hypothetical protein